MAVIVVEITMTVDMTEDMMTVNITAAADHTEGDLPHLTTAEVATDPVPGPDHIRLVVIEE